MASDKRSCGIILVGLEVECKKVPINVSYKSHVYILPTTPNAKTWYVLYAKWVVLVTEQLGRRDFSVHLVSSTLVETHSTAKTMLEKYAKDE